MAASSYDYGAFPPPEVYDSEEDRIPPPEELSESESTPPPSPKTTKKTRPPPVVKMARKQPVQKSKIPIKNVYDDEEEVFADEL